MKWKVPAHAFVCPYHPLNDVSLTLSKFTSSDKHSIDFLRHAMTFIRTIAMLSSSSSLPSHAQIYHEICFADKNVSRLSARKFSASTIFKHRRPLHKRNIKESSDKSNYLHFNWCRQSQEPKIFFFFYFRCAASFFRDVIDAARGGEARGPCRHPINYLLIGTCPLVGRLYGPFDGTKRCPICWHRIALVAFKSRRSTNNKHMFDFFLGLLLHSFVYINKFSN